MSQSEIFDIHELKNRFWGRPLVASEELDGVDEAGVKRGGPPHPRRPHASLRRKSRKESRRRPESGGVAEVVVVEMVGSRRKGEGGGRMIDWYSPNGPEKPEIPPVRFPEQGRIVRRRGARQGEVEPRRESGRRRRRGFGFLLRSSRGGADVESPPKSQPPGLLLRAAAPSRTRPAAAARRAYLQ